MKTHRCESSLKNGVSIRFTFHSEFMRQDNDKETWRLFNYVPNYDYNCVSSYPIAEIKYCPFCGEELIHIENYK